MNARDKQVVLVAAIGISPAVLTETIWAMAQSKDPVVPARISVITTKSGRDRLVSEILEGSPSVWDEMVKALKADQIALPADFRFGRASITIIPDERGNEAEDLRSAGDNQRAADTMLETLRKYTEDPETVVYASIAGGRKSMSALMFSCMSLLGRTDDRITHVLTNPEAVNMISLKDRRPFYFPKKGHTYEYGPQDRRERISAGKVNIELFDVPFVRTRGWFQEKFKSLPPSYGTLVHAVQSAAPEAEIHPQITFDLKSGVLMIGNADCPLAATDRAMLFLFMSGLTSKAHQFAGLSALSSLRNLPPDSKKALPAWVREYLASSRSKIGLETADSISKMANQLRKKLKTRMTSEQVERLCPTFYRPGSYPEACLHLKNRECLPVKPEED